MNFKTMDIEALQRIFKQVSKELDNRECSDQASNACALLKEFRINIEAIEERVAAYPRDVKSLVGVKNGIQEMYIHIEQFWKELGKQSND